MNTFKNKLWLQHPWSKTGMVEEISVGFLEAISNKHTETYTDDLDGFIKHQKDIFDSIEQNGMRDPLLIIISLKYHTIRLESGNHRINEAILRGYTHLPVATLIIEEKWHSEANGTHFFNAEGVVDFNKLIPNPYPYQMKLSDIILYKELIFN